MRTSMRASVLMLAFAGRAQAWNDCTFPQVDFFVKDHGPGISYTYALAAMNDNVYSGGYMKGNLAMIGVTADGDVQPLRGATIYTHTTSNVQHLYVSETDSTGRMTQGWLFEGSAIQIGAIGHGSQTNSIDAQSGMHKMLDKKHVAIKGGFRQLLTMPDGTQYSSASRANTNDQVPFVIKLDVSKQQGVGAGTTGWSKLMDDGHAGGANVYSVDGDANGDMIVSYKGCGRFNSSAVGSDSYGRPVAGAMEDCSYYVAKLAAADGSEVWKHSYPKGPALYNCRVITDGSFFCGWTTRAGGDYDFGNGVTLTSTGTYVGIVKFDSAGVAQWAKATASHPAGDLSVSADGTLLAVIGNVGGYGRSEGHLSRIDTSAGNEGNVLWTDAEGRGSHGWRGLEVTDDGKEVFVFGQITGETTLDKDDDDSTTDDEHTLDSLGSYDVYVGAYNASDGGPKYSMNGGGTGMEYFFAMAKDPDSNAVYLGGTTRSEYIKWGQIMRNNVMYDGDPGENNPDTSSPIGSSKAFWVKIETTDDLPPCLKSCSSTYGSVQASDVRDGHCYIDRHCYADGEKSEYVGKGCKYCKAAQDALNWWSEPDVTNHCFINDKCYEHGEHATVRVGRSTVADPCKMCDVDVSTDAFLDPVPGCNIEQLFQAGVYEIDGTKTMTMEEMNTMIEEKNNAKTAMEAEKDAQIAALTAEVAKQEATIAVKNTNINTLTKEKIALNTQKMEALAANDVLEAKYKDAKDDADDDSWGTPAIALIATMAALFVLVVFALMIIITKEKGGNPIFLPMSAQQNQKKSVVSSSAA